MNENEYVIQSKAIAEMNITTCDETLKRHQLLVKKKSAEYFIKLRKMLGKRTYCSDYAEAQRTRRA